MLAQPAWAGAAVGGTAVAALVASGALVGAGAAAGWDAQPARTALAPATAAAFKKLRLVILDFENDMGPSSFEMGNSHLLAVAGAEQRNRRKRGL
jgi:cyanophycinase-like exopeptidase